VRFGGAVTREGREEKEERIERRREEERSRGSDVAFGGDEFVAFRLCWRLGSAIGW
jgi:hypothetical protein